MFIHRHLRRSCFFGVAGLALLLANHGLSDNPANGATAAAAPETRDWPSVSLRGYGTVSGTSTRWQLPAGPASILHIQCENPEKARIVQAKYLSDIGLLPGVSQANATGANAIVHWRITGSSEVIAAARSGSDVFIFQASGLDDLATLLSQHFMGDRTALVFTPEGKVPMYLDRWDRFGFRFYYGASTPRPPPGQAPVPYDFNQDFAFAEQSDHAGLVYWDGFTATDSGAGMTKIPAWSWTMAAASARQLPVAINDSVGDALWLTNKYRDQTMYKAPGYVGALGQPVPLDAWNHPQGDLSWSSTTGNDAILSAVQATVRQFNSYPNVVSWLEPHGEIPLNTQNFMTDYGPAPDAAYRLYLQNKYHDLATLDKRWHGDSPQLKSWDDVHVPELAYFRGGGSQAVDLGGTWRVGYETAKGGRVYTLQEIIAFQKNPVPTDPAPSEWYQPAFDDSSWPEVTAPGDDIGMFLPRRPAVFRRNFDMDASVLQKSNRWWVYVWDFNYARGTKMWVYLNGAKVGESNIADSHWAAFEVTGKLQAGSNQISLRLPDGFLGYRIYLSPQPVTDYPNLGEQMNAEWVDYTEWSYASRMDQIRRGVEMIRQVDPNRQITFMHPDDYADGVKEIGEDFGGEFHNTGYMGGVFAELEPMVMRGSDMPFSLEPGGPSHDVTGFKNTLGLYFSECIQGLDYFQRLTDVLWRPDILKHFNDHLKLIHMIGKYHAPKAETALFIDDRVNGLTGYPWGADPSVLLHSGYGTWNVNAGLVELFPVDAVSLSDFPRGNAAKYKVIIDTNTSIMSDELVDDIETYVRNGGIFITCAQTGRHTPTKIDAWPIERLTGYHVTHIDQNVNGGAIPETQTIQPAPNEDVFAGQDWNTDVKPNGLTLEKVAPECQNLMLWQNGKTAIGMRPLGKGWIVEVGVKFSSTRVTDRWDGKPQPPDALWASLYTHLLDHFHIAHVPATLSEPDSPILWRHFVSNNGLYDVWTLWNRSKVAADTVSLQFTKGFDPATCFEIKNEPVSVPVVKTADGSFLQALQFEPLETRIFITPHPKLDHAADDWFDLQRNWWRGTAPIRKELPPFHDDLTADLCHDWTFQPLDDKSDVAAMSALNYDDSKWERRDIGCWGIGDHPEVTHALLRKTFTVPAAWTKGQVYFWLAAWAGAIDAGTHVYLDGKEIVPVGKSIAEEQAGGTLLAGTTHVVTADIQSTESVRGLRAPCWLSYVPDPEDTIDLSGQWKASDDYLNYTKTVTFPGAWDGVIAQKTVPIDARYKGKNFVVNFTGPPTSYGVIFNGVWIGHERITAQKCWLINVTPWVKFGVDNNIRLIGDPVNAPNDPTVSGVKLDIYDPKTYP